MSSNGHPAPPSNLAKLAALYRHGWLRALSSTEALVYVAYLIHADRMTGNAYPKLATIAALFGHADERNVKRARSRLVKLGLLTRVEGAEGGRGKAPVYRVELPTESGAKSAPVSRPKGGRNPAQKGGGFVPKRGANSGAKGGEKAPPYKEEQRINCHKNPPSSTGTKPERGLYPAEDRPLPERRAGGDGDDGVSNSGGGRKGQYPQTVRIPTDDDFNQLRNGPIVQPDAGARSVLGWEDPLPLSEDRYARRKNQTAEQALIECGVNKGMRDKLLKTIPGLTARVIWHLENHRPPGTGTGLLIRTIESEGPRLVEEFEAERRQRQEEQRQYEAALAERDKKRDALLADCESRYGPEHEATAQEIASEKGNGMVEFYAQQRLENLRLLNNLEKVQISRKAGAVLAWEEWQPIKKRREAEQAEKQKAIDARNKLAELREKIEREKAEAAAKREAEIKAFEVECGPERYAAVVEAFYRKYPSHRRMATSDRHIFEMIPTMVFDCVKRGELADPRKAEPQTAEAK